MRKAFVLLSIICISILFACTTQARKPIDEQKAPFRRLTTAIVGELLKNEPGSISEDKLLELTCKNDPSLCSHFEENKIKVKIIKDEVILLLCSSDSSEALLEDVSCTAKLDLWRYEKKSPCSFTIDSLSLCK